MSSESQSSSSHPQHLPKEAMLTGNRSGLQATTNYGGLAVILNRGARVSWDTTRSFEGLLQEA